MNIYNAFNDMHTEMAFRNNASSTLIKAMAQLGKPLNDAIAASLLTLDTIHAPIRSACECFNEYENDGGLSVSSCKRKIPGFGSSWYKGEPDPVVEKFLDELDPDVQGLVIQYTDYVRSIWDRPKLYPNAALATAAFAFQENINPVTAISNVIVGRIDAWVSIYFNNYTDKGFS